MVPLWDTFYGLRGKTVEDTAEAIVDLERRGEYDPRLNPSTSQKAKDEWMAKMVLPMGLSALHLFDVYGAVRGLGTLFYKGAVFFKGLIEGQPLNFSRQFRGLDNAQINELIGIEQRNLLRQWMGSGADAARSAMGRPLPEGLAAETLRAYHEIARRQIEAGLDTVGTQAARIKLIEQALRALGL
jgi:hypothetical protein